MGSHTQKNWLDGARENWGLSTDSCDPSSFMAAPSPGMTVSPEFCGGVEAEPTKITVKPDEQDEWLVVSPGGIRLLPIAILTL